MGLQLPCPPPYTYPAGIKLFKSVAFDATAHHAGHDNSHTPSCPATPAHPVSVTTNTIALTIDTVT